MKAISTKRVVLYGTPLSGKRSRIQSLGRVTGADVARFIVVPGGFEWFGHKVPSPFGMRVVFEESGAVLELVTVGGAVLGDRPWHALFENSSAVIVVLDAQHIFAEGNRESLQRLGSFPNRPQIGCVMVTKADRATKDDIERTKVDFSEFSENFGGKDWPVFVSGRQQLESIIAPVSWLASELVGRMRG